MGITCKPKSDEKTISWTWISGFGSLIVISQLRLTDHVCVPNITGRRGGNRSFCHASIVMFTPKICVIRCTGVSEFCVDRSIEISLYVTGFTRHGIYRRSHSRVCICPLNFSRPPAFETCRSTKQSPVESHQCLQLRAKTYILAPRGTWINNQLVDPRRGHAW